MKNKFIILFIFLLISFLYAGDSKIIIHGTGDPNTSSHIIIGAQGDNKSYIFTGEIMVEDGASLIAWSPSAIGDATISGDGQIIFLESSIDGILLSFDQWVEHDDLYGIGKGKSAQNKLNSLRNLIKSVADNVGEACALLSDAYYKTDGLSNPPDFVAGDAALLLATLILDLRAELRCDANTNISFAKTTVETTTETGVDTSIHFTDDVVTNQVERIVTPTEFKLEQNYPNPFNPVTSIKFSLPEETDVILDIYNSAGQKVETLAYGWFSAGFYDIQWDATNMPSGIYFYKIKAGSFTDLKKMILLK